MITSRSRSFPHLIVAGLLALSATACSTSGGNEGAEPTATTEVTTSSPTAPEPADPTTSTESDPGPSELTVEDLEAILPTASEVGGGYQVQPNDDEVDDDDSGIDAAVEEACPGIDDVFGTDDDDDHVAEVSMEDADGRGFEVKLNGRPKVDLTTIDAQIDAVNRCDTITFTDENDSDLSMDLRASRTDDFGELAVTLTMDVTLENDALPRVLDISFTSRTFLVGAVSVTVTVIDGNDETTYETVPADGGLLDDYSTEMETRVTELLAG